MIDLQAKHFLDIADQSLPSLKHIRRALRRGNAYHAEVDQTVRRDLAYIRDDITRFLNS